MTVLFSSSSPKILKADIFCLIFRRFCFINKFCNDSNFKRVISNMTTVFLKFFHKNTKIRDFWWKTLKWGIFGPKFAFLFLHKILHLSKFEDADFKYGNRFLKFYLKSTVIRPYWSKIPKSGIWGPKFRHFCFFTKFCN